LDALLDEDFDAVSDEADDFSDLEDFSEADDFSEDSDFSDDELFALLFDTVTLEEILSIVLCGNPAFERSLTDEYGRPSMIFFAYALPTPGRASSSSWVAVFRSTFFAFAACATVAGRASARARSATRIESRFFENGMAASPFAAKPRRCPMNPR
jgi:hypothetical protein